MPIKHKFQQILEIFRNNADYRRFSGASLGVLIAKLLGVFIAFFVQIPLTRLLGAEEYGIYVYILSWVMIASILTNMGMNMTFVKYLPIYVIEKKWALLKGLLVFGLGMGTGVYILLISIGAEIFYVFGLQESLFFPFLPATAFLLFLLTISQLIISALRGLKLVLLSEIMETMVKPLTLLASFLFFFYFVSEQNAHAALWGNILALLTITIFMAVHLWRNLPEQAKKKVPEFSDNSAWRTFAFPMMLMSGMMLLLNRIDIIMLGNIAGAADAGIYAIGSRLAGLTAFGLMAVNTILAPRISEMYHAGQLERLQDILNLAAWMVFIFTFSAAIALAVLGPFLLPLFGDDFSGAYIPMLILLGGQMVNALAGSVGFLMTMTGQQKEAAKILFIAVLLNIGGNFLFVPLYGMAGAAIATCMSIVFWNIVLFIRVTKNMHLNPSILPIKI
ncbi:MAG: flippase [Alphaproteobacteria bacterium]|nr:flippase [Alphaproteobacteria bacterium]